VSAPAAERFLPLPMGDDAMMKFWKDESGATAIEYGLIAASIAVVIITAVQLLGTKLTTTFTSVAGAL